MTQRLSCEKPLPIYIVALDVERQFYRPQGRRFFSGATHALTAFPQKGDKIVHRLEGVIYEIYDISADSFDLRGWRAKLTICSPSPPGVELILARCPVYGSECLLRFWLSTLNVLVNSLEKGLDYTACFLETKSVTDARSIQPLCVEIALLPDRTKITKILRNGF